MQKKSLPAIIWKEGNLYVTKTIGIELASQGRTKKEALKNLQEALDLLLEDKDIKVPYRLLPKKVEVECVYA